MSGTIRRRPELLVEVRDRSTGAVIFTGAVSTEERSSDYLHLNQQAGKPARLECKVSDLSGEL